MKTLKKLAYPLRLTPLHPQWFCYLHDQITFKNITRYSSGLVVDIGCGNGSQKKYLNDKCSYYGLDLPFTSINWYETRPDIYGTADVLPIKDNSVSTILLLDVLEHLEAPQKCFEELSRVLTPEGILIVKIPFLYPIHDAPLDFSRWTEHGLLQLFNNHNFKIIESEKIGLPIETATLLLCIAISKHTLNWINNKSIYSVIGILLSAMIPFINICAWLISKISNDDSLMPHTYHYVLKKNA